MRLIDADALTDFLKCLLPERGMWEIDGDAGKNAVCETVAEAIEMVKNMETIKPETNCSEFPNSSDCISRRAAIDVAKDWYDGLICGSFKGLEKRLKALPSAQPRTGKWVDDGTEFGCCCSECGNTLDDYFDGLTEDVRLMKIPDFCLSCGADMREGEQE